MVGEEKEKGIVGNRTAGGRKELRRKGKRVYGGDNGARTE